MKFEEYNDFRKPPLAAYYCAINAHLFRSFYKNIIIKKEKEARAVSKIGSYVQQEILPTLKGDIIGGISVAFVAFPLALIL